MRRREVVVEQTSYTRAWPDSAPLPSLRGAPTARRPPSALSATDPPDSSLAASPSMSLVEVVHLISEGRCISDKLVWVSVVPAMEPEPPTSHTHTSHVCAMEPEPARLHMRHVPRSGLGSVRVVVSRLAQWWR